MPEGHTLHRLAADLGTRFGGDAVSVGSPQGRFASSAALLDGSVLEGAEAHGKHLFIGFGAGRWIHIHLGLIGTVRFDGDTGGQVRLRITGPGGRADLRGPQLCALVTDAEKARVHARLGPDPLRASDRADGAATAWRRIGRSGRPIAALLMDQQVLAGVGNVYRAEVLFRHGVDPFTPGRELGGERWRELWDDLVGLMAEGVRRNRIDTVRPEHEPAAMGRPPRVDDHGGEVYVYRRAGDTCHICGTPIATRPLDSRNLFWCPTCQP
ncbi:DNA glycosylase [Mangrovactinospora gilvigrisea]|uniref:DNA-(apurinic or apyrimidinic site) lyase n=1 Tax=Mangrovactinospora gilvigrisea TaxID=1428644 RepID=A0A1J7BGB9_9ACTN|nr:DNA-formamidopyrimidine glycosylase family protein [Mangrovactinospora gilvigrisea]OIV37715.1 DNA glycosylase [Mangrovactinospora gilvigrisea]